MEVMNEWLLICNSAYFDIKKAFSIGDTLTWPQQDELSVGDIVYFYVTNPYKAILYKCAVEEINLHHMDKDSKECVTHVLFYENKQVYMRLKLLKTYPENLFTDEEIRKNGVESLQVTSKVSKEFSKNISQKERQSNKENKHSNNRIIFIIALIAIVGVCICLAVKSWKPSNELPGTTKESTESVLNDQGKIKADVTTIMVGEKTNVAFETDGYLYRKDEKLIWTSSDDTIATVDENGIVTGKTAGTVTIIGKFNLQEASIDIKIEEKKEELTSQGDTADLTSNSVESVEIFCYTNTLLAGDSINTRIKADSLILDGNSESITWRTDNQLVASIDNQGVLTANAAGTCNLIAEYGGKTVTQEIIVVEEDKKSGATVKADYEKISLSSYGEDTVILSFNGNMPEHFGAIAYYSAGVSLSLKWGELKDNSVPLTIGDLSSIENQGYVTVLVYEDSNPNHIIATTKINVRIN